MADFRYLAQSRSIDDRTLLEISNALSLFHTHKQAILDANARVGKSNNPLKHFFIPKLELLHSVVMSIRWSGPPIQWSADPTERAHIDAIKVPSENTNNGQYGPQICRYLDRDKRRQLFDLCTAIHEAGGNLESIIYNTLGEGCDDDEVLDDEFNENWVAELDTVGRVCGPSRKTVDLFAVADALVVRAQSDNSVNILSPLRTFSTPYAAFNLGRRPDIPHISVDSLAEKYQLPDLRPALLDFLNKHAENISVYRIGGRRRSWMDDRLPFNDVAVWYSIRLQTRSLDDGLITEPRRLVARPPCDSWPLGRYDSVIFSHDSANPLSSPGVGLDGMSAKTWQLRFLHLFLGFTVAQIRLILHPIWDIQPADNPLYLIYAHRFDIIPQPSTATPTCTVAPNPTTGLYLLKRALRSDQTRIGDIIPLSHCRMPAQLVPHYGVKADTRLTSTTSMEKYKEFFLNGYFDKDFFQYLRSSRP